MVRLRLMIILFIVSVICLGSVWGAVGEAANQADDSYSFFINGEAPKPGQTPHTNSITVQMQAHINFPSPFKVASVRLYNPSESNMAMVYVLRMSVAALKEQAGITGYTDEAYASLSARQGFDPAASYIILSQSDKIAPGESINQMSLGLLPDGSALQAGDYQGELLMVPFDEDNNEAMVNAVIDMPFSVASSLLKLTADDGYMLQARIFNPINAQAEYVYKLQISQAQIEQVTGSTHRTEAELAEQAQNPSFDPAYEFITLFESQPIAPGMLLNEITLKPLPDGERLPSGEYTGWLVRYIYDEQTKVQIMQDVDTQVQIVIR